MVSFMTVACILTMWAAVAASGAAGSVPSQLLAGLSGPAQTTADCSTVIYDMMGCLDFLMNGGTETTPKYLCCLGFKRVQYVNADCICYAISMSGSLGLDINMTRAESLPSYCRVSAPPISHCHVSTSPSESPANPPAASAPPLNHPTLVPTMQPPAATPTTREAPGAAPYGMASGPASQVPTPSPAHAGANAIFVSFSAFVVIVGSFLVFNA